MRRNYSDFAKAYMLVPESNLTGSGAFIQETGVDIKGLTKGVVILIAASTGAIHNTGTLTWHVQKSADNSTWTDIFSTGATLTGTSKAACHIAPVEVCDLYRYIRFEWKGEAADVFSLVPVFVGWDATTQPLP
jgi:hypothetical protein